MTFAGPLLHPSLQASPRHRSSRSFSTIAAKSPLCFHIVTHSFAKSILTTPLASGRCALFAKNTGGGGSCFPFWFTQSDLCEGLAQGALSRSEGSDVREGNSPLRDQPPRIQLLAVNSARYRRISWINA